MTTWQFPSRQPLTPFTRKLNHKKYWKNPTNEEICWDASSIFQQDFALVRSIKKYCFNNNCMIIAYWSENWLILNLRESVEVIGRWETPEPTTQVSWRPLLKQQASLMPQIFLRVVISMWFWEDALLNFFLLLCNIQIAQEVKFSVDQIYKR